MGPDDHGDPLAAAVAALAPDRRAALVAATERARGRTVSGPDGDGVVIVESPHGGASERIAVAEGPAAADADRVVDAGEQARRLRYALEHEVALELVEEYLADADANADADADADADANAGADGAADPTALLSASESPVDGDATEPGSGLAGDTRDGSRRSADSGRGAPAGPPRPAAASATATGTASTGTEPTDTATTAAESGATAVSEADDRIGATDPSPRSPGPDRRRLALVAAALAVALAVGAVAVGGVGGGAGPLAGAFGDDEPVATADADRWETPESGPDAEATADGPATVASTRTPGAGAEAGSGAVGAGTESGAVDTRGEAALAPGIDADGSLEEATLARATTAVLRETNYTLTLTYRERRTVTVARWRERVAVGGPGRFAAAVVRLGNASDPPSLGGDAYADGTSLYERRADGEVTVEPLTAATEGRYTERIGRYIDWYLSVRNSRVRETFVRDGRTYYWVTLRGDPWPGVENTTGSALVDERGVVHEIHRTYTIPGDAATTVTVTVEVSGLGRTTVEAPAWVETNGTTTGDTGSGGENRYVPATDGHAPIDRAGIEDGSAAKVGP